MRRQNWYPLKVNVYYVVTLYNHVIISFDVKTMAPLELGNFAPCDLYLKKTRFTIK